MDPQPNNPLHGLTLEMILNHLVDYYGWNELGSIIRIKCFTDHPSINSSLKFLRTTPWARKQIENLYLEFMRKPGGLHPSK
jgi:uncharacterized protein (DUF2132 family)